MRRRASGRPRVLGRLSAAAAAWLGLLLAGAWPVAAQQLAVDPHICIPSTREFSVSLAIGAGGHEVVGLEVEIAFDPAIVRLLGVDAGTWITGSGLESFFYDHTAPGATTIHLTAAFLGGGWDGAGQLAVCRFEALATGTCPLTFVHLDVRDAANVDLGFAHSTGDVIIIEQAIPVDPSTWGGIKAQYR